LAADIALFFFAPDPEVSLFFNSVSLMGSLSINYLPLLSRLNDSPYFTD